MRLLNLSVTNFRGIKSLNWAVKGRINCLVGCGDSTKTTMLDAIEMVLSPRWNIAFSDSDFYDCDYTSEISIRALVGDLPVSLLAEDKFGLYLLGWDEGEKQPVEFVDGLESAVMIELKVNSNLEPEWTVIPLDAREARHISSKDRESLGVTRLGEYIDRHATWSRGSSLARMGDGSKTVREVIADANRSAMVAVRDLADTPLHANATEVETLARALGVSPKGRYVPGLDWRSFGDSSANLSLHDGEVPLRMSGLGSRRLVAAAIQKSTLKNHGAVIVDELEHGLEPHRIIHLVRDLTSGNDEDSPQVFMTTHSPSVIAQVGSGGISVVHCNAGITTVTDVPAEGTFAGLVRAKPEALLGKKIIVCEGPTEGGVCWALDRSYQDERGSFGLLGVVVADGGGSQAPGRAVHLSKLGYDVAFFGDSDVPLNPDQSAMEEAGIRVFIWNGAMATEERVFSDLPVPALQEALDLARQSREDVSLRDQVRGKLPSGAPEFNLDIAAWISQDGNEGHIRSALGKASKKNSWYKNWTDGEAFGRIAIRSLALGIGDSDTEKILGELINWAAPMEGE